MSDSSSIRVESDDQRGAGDRRQRAQPDRDRPDGQTRPSDNLRQQQQPSHTSSTLNTHSSYASFPSQSSLRAPPSQPGIPPRAAAPLATSTAPHAVRGYQNITSVEPAPKRPLWSLGSTLPRVRRLPAVKQKPQQQGQTLRCRDERFDPRFQGGGANAPVLGHDFARNTNIGYSAAGPTPAADESLSPTTTTMTTASSASAGELPPIREGERLPTEALAERTVEPTMSGARRPQLESSFSSPTAAETARARPVNHDELALAGDPVGGTTHDQSSTSEPQQRLSTARQQLLEEAQQGQGLIATQGSAIEDVDDPPPRGGISSFPASKHIKTSSMPFLPSQGFDVLVSEPSHKGADQLNSDMLERKKSRADSHRSAMDQTRHPGLSGARPTPRGRAAGGPAAGVGIRKPSTQSARRAEPSYFDEHAPAEAMQGAEEADTSTAARQSGQDDHIEPRPVGGRRSESHNDGARDTRSAWLGKSMPSQVGTRDTNGDQRADKEDHVGRNSDETVVSSYGTNQDDELEQDQGEGFDDEHWLGGQGTLADGSIAFPTTWSRWRYHSREFLAELLATMLLITVGTAVDCQVTLSQSMGPSAGAYPNQNWAWGLAVASTIYLSGGRSGAHCNPAITLALAVFRGFPWIQVPIYWSAQLLGSILGAAITYGIYLPAINQFEGGPNMRTLSGDHGTGRLFVTVPQLVFTSASGFGTEVAATSILMAMVLAVGDETNAPPSDGLSALVLGFVVVMIGMSFGWPTSYAISPSRDLGPRLFLYMVGYGRELWTHNDYWWLYGPQAGCFAGALLGALLYDLAIFTGEESPINYTPRGWGQSTPARIGSRVLNSADRMHFWKNPLRRAEQGSDAGKDEAEETRAVAMLKKRAAAIGESVAVADERSTLDVQNDLRRRQSQVSQQLDAQEQGRSQPGSGDES